LKPAIDTVNTPPVVRVRFSIYMLSSLEKLFLTTEIKRKNKLLIGGYS
jgi:hypothetical protein